MNGPRTGPAVAGVMTRKTMSNCRVVSTMMSAANQGRILSRIRSGRPGAAWMRWYASRERSFAGQDASSTNATARAMVSRLKKP